MNAVARGLDALLAGAGIRPVAGSDPTALGVAVQGLALDSRRVRPGELFLALPGSVHDGRQFISEAVARGAAVICVDSAVTDADRAAAGSVPVLGIDELGAAAGLLANAYFDAPSRALRVLGVTGTNGKTSSAHHLAEMLGHLGEKAGICGTLGNGLPGQLRSTGLTTSDPVSLHGTLAWLRDAGAGWVAMEVSSHALDQERVAGIRFAGALFTNLSRDHLDYHGTMAAYGESKRRLFLTPGLEVAAVNRDDPVGRSLQERMSTAVEVLDFSLRDTAAAVHLTGMTPDAGGALLAVRSPWGSGVARTRLIGEFAFSNLLGSLTLLAGLGLPFRELLAAADVAPVSGRMQAFAHPGGCTLVVDYAHTPTALAQALAAVRGHFPGRVFCVFGCGGERDAGKRPEMGAAAAAAADVVVVTDDNPRREDGQAIIDGILAGIPAAVAVRVERDRRRAITLALAEARSGDVVLIAGKGHEDYQDGPGGRIHYSDLETAAALIDAAASAAPAANNAGSGGH